MRKSVIDEGKMIGFKKKQMLKTVCPKGHPLTKIPHKKNQRWCMICITKNRAIYQKATYDKETKIRESKFPMVEMNKK